MQQNKLIFAGVILALMLSAVSLALQVKQATSPFEKYRQSSASELDMRKARFNIAALRNRAPDQNGIAVPFVEGNTADGRLLIHVDVRSSLLPSDVEARKDAMLSTVGEARASFSWGFGTIEEATSFDKWVRVAFFDVDVLLKSTAKKPLDPVIGIYENGELVLR